MKEHDSSFKTLGESAYAWASDLFPYCRSLTGNGLRQTLAYLKRQLPDLQIHEVASGTRALDWAVPDEWNIRGAWIESEAGERIVDFRNHNLHVVGYSTPIDAWMSLEELDPHLHSIPEQPDAIPYMTTYYRKNWGFCLPHRIRQALKPGRYHVHVDATLSSGSLTYADLLLPGESQTEVFFSTYVCHPSMANDELSGPVTLAALIQWLSGQRRKLSYRFVFVPEMIGSLVYLSQHLETLKRRVRAGLVVACVGDDRAWSMISSRMGNTISDRILRRLLTRHADGYTEYSYLWPNRGSDERNYCMPGIDLPMPGLCRSKYATFPEYHTSLDDLSLISPTGLAKSIHMLARFCDAVEASQRYRITCLGEPQLGPRGFYPIAATHRPGFDDALSLLMNILAYCDGNHDVVDIAELIGSSVEECQSVIDTLCQQELLHES